MNTSVLTNQLSINNQETWLRRRLVAGITPARLILLGIVAMSAAFHFYRLSDIGDANLYYTAAVESMLQSWKNFFFVAAEPGGSVTVDKPPLGLWVEAASAFIFGVNGFAVVLPNILAGLISIPLIYTLVKKYFGTVAGLIAALVVAITPVSIAAQRNNTMDGLLTLALILAAWAFLKATESGRLRYLWLGAVLVGLGFNIKMLQAFLPLPAFYAVYFLGAKTGWVRKALNLLAATIILLAVSLSWAAAVDLTPAGERPYIGSSTDNTVMELIVGHNGLSRLFGAGGSSQSGGQTLPDDGGAPDGQRPSGGPNGRPGPPNGGQGQFAPPDNFQPPSGGPGGGFAPPNGDGPPGSGGAPTNAPGGSGEVGESGLFRFFTAPLSKEMSWLLPLALLGGLAVLLSRKITLPLSPAHQMLVVWGGWLAAGLIFFSVAGFFHAYYLVMLAPPLAVLVGAGVMALWRLRSRHAWLAGLLLAVMAAGTFAFQWFNATQFIDPPLWLWVAAALLSTGIGLVLWSWQPGGSRRSQQAALAVLLSALLITPLTWSALTAANSSSVNLPAAYQGETAQDGAERDRRTVDDDLLAYLQANTQDVKYLMAVPSSMQGAQYVLASGRPVLYMGGFNGSDPVVSTADLAQMVANDELRYIVLGGGRGGQQTLTEWVESSCTAVSQFNSSQPGGFPPATGPNSGPTSLYQCS